MKGIAAKSLTGFILSLSGIGFFVASIYMVYQGNVTSSLLSAAIGLFLVSLGSDLLRES